MDRSKDEVEKKRLAQYGAKGARAAARAKRTRLDPIASSNADHF